MPGAVARQLCQQRLGDRCCLAVGMGVVAELDDGDLESLDGNRQRQLETIRHDGRITAGRQRYAQAADGDSADGKATAQQLDRPPVELQFLHLDIDGLAAPMQRPQMERGSERAARGRDGELPASQPFEQQAAQPQAAFAAEQRGQASQHEQQRRQCQPAAASTRRCRRRRRRRRGVRRRRLACRRSGGWGHAAWPGHRRLSSPPALRTGLPARSRDAASRPAGRRQGRCRSVRPDSASARRHRSPPPDSSPAGRRRRCRRR
ncbi:MAG: hypothetical protein AW07_02479 [Candidatus Accumulibacter sp. SK-11]|nr:MAG: hypothetical protein AW07_02479 [Candidatus Accumulibacter sp. SK-11]